MYDDFPAKSTVHTLFTYGPSKTAYEPLKHADLQAC